MKINKEFGQSIQILKLNDDELKAFRALSAEKNPSVNAILSLYCKTIVSVIKLAIYNPRVLQWCRQNTQVQKNWRRYLNGFEKLLNNEFKSQKNLSDFDLLAGLVLTYESRRYRHEPAKQLVILFIAMEKFKACYAACFIADKSIEILENSQSEINAVISSMTSILIQLCKHHGAPGYFIASQFYKSLTDFFLKDSELQRAAGAMHLCYRYLLTAANLEKSCDAEIHNATLSFDLTRSQISFQKNILPNLTSTYKNLIDPIAPLAEREAKGLALQWNRSCSP